MMVGMSGMNEKLKGHLMALFCALVWGTTFVASKRLLSWYSPVQLMFLRFAAAYVVLRLAQPRREKTAPREELYYLLMGVTGCTLYFWSENTALTLTWTANVSTIVALAPLLTAILAHIATKGRERLDKWVWIGFAAAFTGVALVVCNGAFVLKLSPAGDLLALLTALLWAVYCIQQSYALERRSSLFITRKVLFYGLVTSLPLMMLLGGFRGLTLTPLVRSGGNLFCFLFLAVLGNAACYYAWAAAERRLGPVVTSNYIYTIPFITLAASAAFLDEPITPAGVAGAVLIVAGVWISSAFRGK